MTVLFFDCFVRSGAIAIATATVLWALRIKSAAVCHAAWGAVLVAMLLLPIWSSAGPKVSLRVLQPAPAAPIVTETSSARGPLDVALPEVPANDVEPAGGLASSMTIDREAVLFAVYLLGACALLVRLAIGTVHANRLRRTALLETGRATSKRCAAPITIGWFAPVTILPTGWQQWPAEKLEVVLAHERAHARRRDPLVQWFALVNRALFWFHPLAWWLDRKLATLAEEACDAAVLAAGYSAETYSECLVDLARSVTRHGRRVRLAGMAMPGSGLTDRLRHILEGASPTSVSRVRVAFTFMLCAASTALFASATLSPRTLSPIDAGAGTGARRSSTAAPKFDVVSVKPCDPKAPQGGRGGNVGTTSPGRLHIECQNLYNLINTAFVTHASGHLNPPWTTPTFTPDAVLGWMTSDRFTIDATGDAATLPAVMRGPMLQAVLEERFKLKLRRETREVPVDELVVAKGGPKLTPLQLGACVPFNWTEYPAPPLPPGQHTCQTTSERDSNGQNWVLRSEGMTLDQIAAHFSRSDRPVVNKTGIAGVFSFRVVYSGGGDTLMAAVKDQLGLEMRPTQGAHDFLIVDHAERPTPNESVSSTQTTATSVPAKFDVVSIKPCKPADVEPGARGGRPGESLSPNRMHLDCAPLVGPNGLIRQAYIAYANGQANRFWEKAQIAGAPAWATTDRYTIDATSSGAPGLPAMRGPMLRKVLEDRFRLQIHRETKPIPVYELTVAKGGPRLKPFTGGCTPVDLTKNIPAQLETPGICMFVGQNDTWDARGENIEGFISLVLTLMDRPIIDKTGLTGRYDIHLKIAHDDQTGANELPTTIAVDLQQQLGLKLTPATGPGQFLVIDHVERPTPDSVGAPVLQPARARGAGR